MMEDLYFNDFEYNDIEYETIEQHLILIDDKIIEILPDYRGMDVVYDWFEIDTKCRIKFCNNYWADLGLRCTQWDLQMKCKPEQVKVDIQVPEDIFVIIYDTGVFTEPTIMGIKPDHSDSNSSSTVMIQTADLNHTEYKIQIDEDKDIDTVNVMINDAVTPTIPSQGKNTILIIADDTTSNKAQTDENTDPEQPVAQEVGPAKTVYADVETKDFIQATTQQEMIAEIETIVNKDG